MCFGGGGGGDSSPTIAAPVVPTPVGNSADATAALPTPAQLSGSGPLPYQDFGAIPQVTATTMAAPMVDPNSAAGAGLSMGEQANATALQPIFQAQDMAQSDNLASRGIVNSGAATYLDQNLKQGQDATLAGANAPLIEQAAGNVNQDTLANQNSALETGLTNLGFENQATNENASAYGNVVSSNEGQYNAYQNELEQQGSQYGEALLQGYLGSYGGANPQTLSTIGQGPGAVGAAGAEAAQNTPNFGAAFSNAFSSLQPGGGGGFGSADSANGGGGSGGAASGITDGLTEDPELAAAGF